jgi:four helix bundle protein
MAIARLEDLEVWRLAHALTLYTYRQTQYLPVEERFGLLTQMRRAAASVPGNIAEGFKRRGEGDKVRFYNYAEASLEELRYYYILCRDLGYLAEADEPKEQVDRIGRMLNRLIHSLKRP